MAGKRKEPSRYQDDLRVQAAKAWQKREGYQKTHDAFVDEKFKQKFNQYVKNPTARTRKQLGLHTRDTNKERKELQLIRTLKQFGDTP